MWPAYTHQIPRKAQATTITDVPPYPRAYKQYNLEYEAARYSLKQETAQSLTAQATQRQAKAQLTKLQSQLRIGTADAHDVNRARQVMNKATGEARVAAAQVRSRRAELAAAKSVMQTVGRDPENSPFARLSRQHEAITRQFLEYETDPMKQLGFPNMTDGRHPLTAKFLEAQQRAGWLRPEPTRKVSAIEFARYRDAVAQLQHAFAVAEADARGLRPPSTAPLSLEPLTNAATGWFRQLSNAARRAWEDTKREWSENPVPPTKRDDS